MRHHDDHYIAARDLCLLLVVLYHIPPSFLAWSHSGEAWDVSALEQKCEAAKSIGCASLFVPSGNACESRGVPLIGMDDLQMLLHHHAIGKGEGKPG